MRDRDPADVVREAAVATDSSTRRDGGLTERAVALATWMAIAVTVLCAGLVLTFDHGRDQSIYSLVAREILDGRMPYRDAFDFKPPGIFMVYAAARAVFGPAQVSIRIVEVLSMLATAWGLVRLSELWFGRRTVGIFAAALASQVHAQLDFWHTAQPETFGGTLTIWALVLVTRALDTPSRRRVLALWAGAGVLLGVAGLMKPPLAGVGVVLVVLVAGREIIAKRSLRSVDPDRTWVPLAGMAAGGIFPIVLTVAWFSSKGALGDLRQVLFVFTPEYTKISWQKQSVLPMTYYGTVEWLTSYSSALLTGMLCLLAFRPTKSELPGVIATFSAIAVHIAGVVMQAKFFPYHWGATFPLTALVAALGLEKALLYSTRKGPVGVAAFGVIFSILASAKCSAPNFGEGSFGYRTKKRLDLLMNPPKDVTAWDDLACIADVDAVQNRQVATWLAENTTKDQPVFIWGFECAIYDMADRPLSSRYIYNVPQRAIWSAKPMQESLMKDLEAAPPAAIVVEYADIFPHVTGSADDSAVSLGKFPALRRMMDEDYVFMKRIGDFDVYLRRQAPYQQAASPSP